ncbi:MAG: hypothetical protein REI64_04630 [Pedobacter sp.]|uniref:hypothetical protein n=1 Tax=Pedobacter sp. TaxID=1411316 RepID=UPI002807677A|nr:hypothetical protein [Pedobacter sp.]MDQ8004064.1 hypothetical protein [Pedobacter sp.]
MKKKLLALLVIGSAVVVSSCSKIKEATNQDITLTTAAVTLTIEQLTTANANSAVISSKISSAELDALIKQKASGFGIKNVKSLKIKTLKAKIINPVNDASNNFNNLGAVSAKLEGNGKTFTANHAVTTSATYELNFTVDSSVDIKDIVSASTVSYSLSAPVRTPTNKPITIELVATYDAVVGL